MKMSVMLKEMYTILSSYWMLFTQKLSSRTEGLGVVGVILIGSIFARFLIYTDYKILHKMLQLCRFMQTVRPHEKHVESFFVAHTQSSKISNFGIISALSEWQIEFGTQKIETRPNSSKRHLW